MTVNEIHVIKYIKQKAKNIYLVVLITSGTRIIIHIDENVVY